MVNINPNFSSNNDKLFATQLSLIQLKVNPGIENLEA